MRLCDLQATQAAPQPSQPSSPVAAPAAGAPPHLPPQQFSAAAVPLQQSNGMFPTANGLHKPPLPPAASRQGAAPSAVAFGGPPPPQQHGHPPQQQYAPPALQQQHGAPVGHVSAAAAELQARMQQGAAQPPYGAPGGDAAAQLASVWQEKGRLEGQNKQLQFTLAQKEKELASLKQRAAQLEKPAGPAGGGPGAHRSAFQVGEMQRQLDSARQQLTFREQEVGAGLAFKVLSARPLPGGWRTGTGTGRHTGVPEMQRRAGWGMRVTARQASKPRPPGSC